MMGREARAVMLVGGEDVMHGSAQMTLPEGQVESERAQLSSKPRAARAQRIDRCASAFAEGVWLSSPLS
jgi:hypothetical protein